MVKKRSRSCPGKTRLLNEAFHQENTKFLYLFISRKSERSLVAEFAEIINSELGVKFFQPQSLRDIIEFLLDYTKQKPLTIIIDEFQDIDIVNPALFSDIQNLWDANKRDSMMHLVLWLPLQHDDEDFQRQRRASIQS